MQLRILSIRFVIALITVSIVFLINGQFLSTHFLSISKIFGVKRQLLQAILPIGDAILEVANEVMPLFLDAIEKAMPFIEEFAVLLGDFLVKAANDFSKWMIKTGIPALKKIWKFIQKNVIPIFEDLWKLFGQSKKQENSLKASAALSVPRTPPARPVSSKLKN